MAFKIDRSSPTGYSDEIFSIALRGRHADNKFASKKEIEFAKNILANQNAIRSSRFASLTRGIKRGSVSRADEELYRKQATIRNASPDLSLVYRINQSLGIGRSRAVSKSDVLSAFTANPYRHKVEEAIRQSALARAASSFSGNDDVVDEQLLERKIQLRDRIRAFREATKLSRFGRYAQAEKELYRKQATIRNASPGFPLMYRINQSLGIDRPRAVSKSDVLSAFTANPYRHKVEEAIRQSALARAASSFSGNDDVVDEQLLERKIQLRDRIRAFREATKLSGFGRYAQAERASNEDIDRRNRLAAEAESRFRYDTMDEFDQRMHDLTERYNGDTSKAEEVYKKTLQKELPAFFRNSKMSAKDMNRLADAWGEFAQSNPMAARLAKNPIMYGGLAAYGSLLWGMGKSDAANKSVIAWSNARNIYGSGSSAFQRAAYMAGVEDPGAISRRLGKQAIRYGGSANAESVYREFGSMMSGMTRDEKMYFAESVGFDDTDVAIAEMLAGGMKPSLARKVGANKAMLEAQKMAGFASGAGAGATAESLWLSIPGMASAKARDLEGWASTDKGRKAAIDSYISTMSAAIGDDAYSENTSQSGTLTPSVSGGTSVSVHGNIIIENADNAQDVAEGIKNYVDKHTSRLRAATSQDPGAQ